MTTITLIPIIKDNYAYLLEAENGEKAILDPGDAAPITEFLKERGIDSLDYIFITHHHWDHVDGIPGMLEFSGAKLVGPAAEEEIIGPLDIKLHDGDTLTFGGEDIQIIQTKGHTQGMICYYLPDTGAAFTSDCLFSMSCGRLFEGAPEDMWHSFERLMALPDETKIYCGHEYTLKNAEFCLTIEPDNQDLKNRHEEVKALRAQGKPTIPTTIALEKKTNAFLRAGSAKRFAEIRKMRDNY